MTPTSSRERLAGRLGRALVAVSLVVGCGACVSTRASTGGASAPTTTPQPAVGADEPDDPVTLESQDAALAAALRQATTSRTAADLATVGQRYYELGVRDMAMRYFSSSLLADPTYAPAHDGLARAWRDGGLPAVALGSAHRATYFAPTSPEAWNTLGTIRQELSLHGEAAVAYRRAIELDPAASYARNNLCYLTFLRGDFASAASECEAAVKRDGTYTPARNNLALAQAAGGDSTQAFESFAAAGGRAVAHYNLGLVHLAKGDYAAAVKDFESAYHEDPSFDQAYSRARQARRLSQKNNMETPNGDRRR